MAIPECNTDLRGGKTFAGELGDVVDNIVRGGLQP